MSVHLVDQASKVQLPSHLKLALLCFADSGTNDGHIAMPGIDGVMTWCGVGKSQAYDLISQLCELQLITKTRGGWRGRRAEYRVFPNGCCETHGKRPAEVRPVRRSDVEEVAQSMDSGVPESCPAEPDLWIVQQDRTPSTDAFRSDPPWIPAESPMDSTGHAQIETPPLLNSKDTSPGSHLPAHPTEPRALRFDDDPVDGVFQPPTSAASRPTEDCGLPNCVDGTLHDRHGLPKIECPACRTAATRSRKAAG